MSRSTNPSGWWGALCRDVKADAPDAEIDGEKICE